MPWADVFLVVGFLLVVAGVGLWSIPAALCLAGTVLFISGGLMSQRERRRGA